MNEQAVGGLLGTAVGSNLKTLTINEVKGGYILAGYGFERMVCTTIEQVEKEVGNFLASEPTI